MQYSFHKLYPTQTFFFFCGYWGLNPGAFYLRATPLALFFIPYFQTGSYEVAESLTK